MYGVHQFLKKEGQKKYKDAKAEVNHKMPPGGPLSLPDMSVELALGFLVCTRGSKHTSVLGVFTLLFASHDIFQMNSCAELRRLSPIKGKVR